MGLEYIKARRLALRRKYPEAFEGEEELHSEWHDIEEDYEDSLDEEEQA